MLRYGYEIRRRKHQASSKDEHDLLRIQVSEIIPSSTCAESGSKG